MVRPLQGRRDERGRLPWAAGTEGVPLPTATQFSPLRGSGGGRRGSKSNVAMNRLRVGSIHHATSFCGGLTALVLRHFRQEIHLTK